MAQKAPKGLGLAGRRLWRSVTDVFELEEHEMALLREACGCADACERLAGVVAAEGEMTTTRLGEPRAHPALVELRMQRLTLARLLVALRIPAGDEDAGRPQRRGLRGVYPGAVGV